MRKLLIFGGLLVLLDLITKWIFSIYNYDFGFFSLTYVENYGAAFGILQNQRFLFILVAIVVIFAIFLYYKNMKWKWPLIFLFAGALGNLIDRLAFGFVRDFVSIGPLAVFNLADLYSDIGVILLIIYWLKEDEVHTKLFKALRPKNK